MFLSGDFKDSLMHGDGIYRCLKNNNVMEGKFVDGQFCEFEDRDSNVVFIEKNLDLSFLHRVRQDQKVVANRLDEITSMHALRLKRGEMT